MRQMGIYRITCMETGKVYIGQSKDVKNRFRHHLSQLKRGRHGNPYLSRAYHKYGRNNFRFEIIEICEEKDLNEREIHYMALYKSCDEEFGYNILSSPYFREAIQAKWADPVFLDKMRKVSREKWKNDKDYRDRCIKGIKENQQKQIKKYGCLAFSTIESREKMAARIKELCKDPEWIKKKSDFAYSQLADPEYAEKNLKNLEAARNSPQKSENLRKHNEKLAQDEEFQSQSRDRQIRLWNDPEHREKRVLAIKKSLSSPEMRQKKIEALTDEGREKIRQRSRELWIKRKMEGWKLPPRSPESEAKRLEKFNKTIQARKEREK